MLVEEAVMMSHFIESEIITEPFNFNCNDINIKNRPLIREAGLFRLLHMVQCVSTGVGFLILGRIFSNRNFRSG